MMKLALIASTISAAAAFAPQPQAAARTSAVEATNPKASYQDTWAMDFAQEPGATAPVSYIDLVANYICQDYWQKYCVIMLKF